MTYCVKTKQLYEHLRPLVVVVCSGKHCISHCWRVLAVAEASSKSAVGMRNEILIFCGPCSNGERTSKSMLQKRWLGVLTTSSPLWIHLCW